MESMTDNAVEPFRVVFVCTGNICRSPTCQSPVPALVEPTRSRRPAASANSRNTISAIGEQADQRTIEALERRGYDGGLHRARQFTLGDFAHSDLVVALDRSHERILRGWARSEADADKIALLMSFDPNARTLDVPDPYYAGPGMFDEVLGMIESACRALFRQLEPAIRPAN